MIKKRISKEEERKKVKRNQFILVGFVTFLLLGSVFGLIAGSNPTKNKQNTISYKGYKLSTNGLFYNLTVANHAFYFSNNPNSINITYNITSLPNITSYVDSPLYLDSKASIPAEELYNTFSSFAQRIQFACYANSTCNDPTLPIKTCSDNLIIIKTAEKNKIYTKDNCVFIEGKPQDLNQLTDVFILKVFKFI